MLFSERQVDAQWHPNCVWSVLDSIDRHVVGGVISYRLNIGNIPLEDIRELR